MHIDESTVTINGKPYTRYLLREYYRENGKQKRRTVGNLSHCSTVEIEAMRLALKHKEQLAEMIEKRSTFKTRLGPSVGAVLTILEVAQRLGIVDALGDSRQGRLALWQVMARLIDQGSRLSAVRLAGSHAACDLLGLEAFNEDHLYQNLDWLSERQEAIEKHLSEPLADQGGLFLYDVTSSYLEGKHNELAAFGYNRDGKKGKMQIVIGLLCDADGEPLSVEVFEGNTPDTQTMANQIRKVADRFGGGPVTFVGDRGMIKGPQIEELNQEGCHYVTAITNAQIRTLLRHGAFQMDMFDENLAEVTDDSGIRYLLRRNPVRARETESSRQSKLAAIEAKVKGQNEYLAAHPKAHVATATKALHRRIEKLGVSKWVEVVGDEAARTVALRVDAEARAEAAKLDGCYVLKTDLEPALASKEVVHGRYKDLALVEQAFRTSKTLELELRPVHVRLASRTRGHVFVVMLAYRIARELARCWMDLDVRVQEGLDELSQLCSTDILEGGRVLCHTVPEPRERMQALLHAAGVTSPSVLPSKKVRVSTKRKLSKSP